MTLRLFTLVDGLQYRQWMRDGLVKSLQWPANHSSVKNAEWNLYTTQESADEVIEIARPVGISLSIKIVEPQWAGQFLANAVNHCLRGCSEQGDQMLVCPPDTIFSDGSLATFMALAAEPKVVISSPPVRVVPSFFEGFTGEPMSGANMVSLAWKNLHSTWRDANIKLPRNNSFAGGVSWRKVSENIFAVTHLLPTPFYIDPAPSDGEWFRQYGMPGAFDHLWPGKLVDEGRQRYVASSDAAFAVEITEDDKNLPVLYPVDPTNPTNYLGNQKHNHVNRNTVCVFRSA